jgi:hypothetical protein
MAWRHPSPSVAEHGVTGQAKVTIASEPRPRQSRSRLSLSFAETSPSLTPGLLFLGAWAASFVVAWRLGYRALPRRDLVLTVALALAVVSMSRIFGLVWYYLVL